LKSFDPYICKLNYTPNWADPRLSVTRSVTQKVLKSIIMRIEYDDQLQQLQAKTNALESQVISEAVYYKLYGMIYDPTYIDGSNAQILLTILRDLRPLPTLILARPSHFGLLAETLTDAAPLMPDDYKMKLAENMSAELRLELGVIAVDLTIPDFVPNDFV